MSAPGLINGKDYSHSQWTSSFGSGGGPSTPARIVFNGSSGEYRTNSFTGQFSSVVVTDSGGAFRIAGRWSGNGATGNFAFTQGASDKEFNGTWTRDSGGNGTWSGKLAYSYANWNAAPPAVSGSPVEMKYCECEYYDDSGSYQTCYCCWHVVRHCWFWCTTSFHWWGCCNPGGTRWGRGENHWHTNPDPCPPDCHTGCHSNPGIPGRPGDPGDSMVGIPLGTAKIPSPP